MSRYKCPACDWIGSEEDMEDTREEVCYEDGEEALYGSKYTCPNCGFVFAVDDYGLDEEFIVDEEEEFDVKESLARSLQQAKEGKLLPIEQLWEGIDE